jgi:hypothetical protein
MNRILLRSIGFAALLATGAWAGALILKVADPATDAEAKGMKASVIADVSACMEPEKSIVKASYIQLTKNGLERTELQVLPMKTTGKLAVVGTVPAGSVIEVTLMNPNYKNYQPRALVRNSAAGVQWASLKNFFSTPPTDSDVKAVMEAGID